MSVTKGSPGLSRPRKLASANLKTVKEEFKWLVQQKICRLSKGAWLIPIHLDLKQSYLKIQEEYKDIAKPAQIIPEAVFEFLYISPGLSNAPRKIFHPLLMIY